MIMVFSHLFQQLQFMEDGNREEQPIFWRQHLIFSTQYVYGEGSVTRHIYGALGR